MYEWFNGQASDRIFSVKPSASDDCLCHPRIGHSAWAGPLPPEYSRRSDVSKDFEGAPWITAFAAMEMSSVLWLLKTSSKIDIRHQKCDCTTRHPQLQDIRG
ncbi:hypothetical protein EVAR_86158_1 [Eumeta japonica]|uniref:Uncharacterized protein n=1 Tax=Eumeta variegata TaxID=151549 RepID=A0A4C1Z4A6_EUMVA|nr:hypothetical protein EVAR_86158_1 [Eumeta japonica]